MEQDQDVKTVLGITLLSIIITGVFLFLSKLLPLIYAYGFNYAVNSFFPPINAYGFNYAINSFSNNYLLWFIIFIGITSALIIYAKMSNQNFYAGILQNRIVCLAAGILVIFAGIFNIFTAISEGINIYIKAVPVIYPISGLHNSSAMVYGGKWYNVKRCIVYCIPELIILCQITLGIHLVKKSRKAVRDILQNRIVCIAAGILVILERIFDGTLNISNLSAEYIKGFTVTVHELKISARPHLPLSILIIADCIPALILLCEIIIGVYLIIHSKRQPAHNVEWKNEQS